MSRANRKETMYDKPDHAGAEGHCRESCVIVGGDSDCAAPWIKPTIFFFFLLYCDLRFIVPATAIIIIAAGCNVRGPATPYCPKLCFFFTPPLPLWLSDCLL